MIVCMTLHTDFWVVVGTASPVISLAAIVSASDSATLKVRRTGENWRISYYRPLYRISIYIVCLQCFAFFLALDSLSIGHDFTKPVFATAAEVAGLVLLLYASVLISAQRNRNLEQRPKSKKADANDSADQG